MEALDTRRLGAAVCETYGFAPELHRFAVCEPEPQPVDRSLKRVVSCFCLASRFFVEHIMCVLVFSDIMFWACCPASCCLAKRRIGVDLQVVFSCLPSIAPWWGYSILGLRIVI